MDEVLMKLTPRIVQDALAISAKTENNAELYELAKMRNPSRSHYVSYEGRDYPLKAVAVIALRAIGITAYSIDHNTKEYADRFRDLDFDVVRSDDDKSKAREKIWIERLSRPGQSKFRSKLFDIYLGCPLTGCTTRFALEAAHVDPVKKSGSDLAKNGILLRADIHKLFDANLIAISPTDGSVHISPVCAEDYKDVLIKIFSPPEGGPSLKSFKQRWADFRKFS